MLFEEEEVNDDQKPQFAGHVVAVVERTPGQLFSGMLGVLRPSSAATQQKQDAERREREGVDLRGNHAPQQAPRIIWFRPTDKRVPLIAIRTSPSLPAVGSGADVGFAATEQAPHDFIDRPDSYADRLFVACIKRWPITSLHPFGTLVEELGPIGDIETETNALLKDCNFSAEGTSSPFLVQSRVLMVRAQSSPRASSSACRRVLGRSLNVSLLLGYSVVYAALMVFGSQARRRARFAVTSASTASSPSTLRRPKISTTRSTSSRTRTGRSKSESTSPMSLTL